MQELGKALSKTLKLESLKLRIGENEIQDSGAIKLFQSFHNLSNNLTELVLTIRENFACKTTFGPIAANQLSKALQ